MGRNYTSVEPPDVVYDVQAVLVVIIMTLTIVGNALVFVVVYRTESLKSGTGLSIVSLSIADFLRGWTVMTYVLAASVKHGDIKLEDGVCNFGGFCNTLFLSASLLTLAAVSIDRYLAITEPLKYYQLMTMTRAIALLTGVWIISFLNALAPLLGWSSYEYVRSRSICTFGWLRNLSYSVTSVTVSYIVPLIILTFCYANICKVTLKQHRKIAALNNYPGPKSSSRASGENTPPVTRQARFAQILSVKKEKKAAATLFFVFGVFFICITPSYVITIWAAYSKEVKGEIALALALSGLVSYLNSAANPFLYCMLNKTFKQTFLNLIFCRYQRAYSMSNLSQQQAERVLNRQFKLRLKDTESSMSSASEDPMDGRRSTPLFSTDQAFTLTRPQRPLSGSFIGKQRKHGMPVAIPLQRALLIDRMFRADSVADLR